VKLPNIEHLLVFRKNGDRILSPAELQERYKFEPDGTNQYYAINAENAKGFKDSGSALNLTQRGVFDDVLSTLEGGAATEKTIIFGLEPDTIVKNKKKDYVYDSVMGHPGLLEKLAAELAEMQTEAEDAGKRFRIVVRYASEMNDTKLPHDKMVHGYKSTFAQVRQIFKDNAPNVLFSFSAALRADLAVPPILDFWPGDELVDVVAGTWYIGAPDQQTVAIKNMTDYFVDRKAAGKPFALSEIGGCSAKGTGNDAVLQIMFEQLKEMANKGVTFTYVTIFLESKWGTDAKLTFVTA